MLGPTNPWDNDPIVQPAPGFTGVIPGAPAKPKEPSIPVGYEPDPARPGHLQPIAGGPEDPATNDTLDDKTTTFYAQQVLSGAPMPAMGMGKTASQNRQKVMGKVAELAGAQGMTGASLATQITHYKAQSANIQNLEKQLGTVEQNEATALANGQQFLDRSAELPGDTGAPILNSVVQAVQRNVPFVPGHDTVSAMDAAYNTFVNEYAKVVSGSPNGSGTLSDAARREAMNTIRSNAALSQKQAAFAQMKADMANRIAASHKIIQESYQNLTQKPGYEVPASLNLLSLGGPGPGGGSGGPGGTPPGGAGPSGSGDIGFDTPPQPKNPLTPQQQGAYDAFMKANPKATKDQFAAFMTSIGQPMPTNADEILDALHKGAGFAPGSSATEQMDPRAKALSDQYLKTGGGTGAAGVVGATDAISLGTADEFGAGVDALRQSLAGHGSFADNYNVNVAANRDYESRLQGDHPIAYTGGQIAGGLAFAPLGPGAEARSVGELATAGAKTGSALGAVYGFNSGVGSKRFSGAVVGGISGGALGALAPYAGRAVINRVSALGDARGLAPEIANAAQAENVDLLRPMVDPASRGKFGALESAPGSQGVIRNAVDNTRSQIEDRVAALGGDGTALEPGAAGERLQLGGNRYITRTRGIKDRLYKRAENVAGDTSFVPQNAINQADQEIANLSSNPQTNAGEIKFLQGIRDDLAAPGGKTVADIRNIRTGLRGAIGNSNLTMSGAEARANSILAAAGDDIASASPEAGRLYKRADAFYRERQTMAQDIQKAILGRKNDPLDPQKAFGNIQTLAAPGGNLRRLSAVMQHLEPDERQDVAATIAANLGRRAADQPFSTDLFLSQTNKLSPAARRTIFGADGAQSIDNLRTLSQALKEGVGDFNRSKTANSMWRLMSRNFVGSLTGLGAAGAAFGGASGAETGVAAALAGKAAVTAKNVLSARAMVNPRVSMWLAQAAKVSSPSQAQQAVKGLSLVISREPALAHELTPIRDFLDQRVTQLLAAEPASGDQKQQQGR